MEAEDIGGLIDLALRRRHETYRGFADKQPSLNVKTLMSAIRSERKPIPRSRALIEEGLGWAPGTIDWLWANYELLDASELDPLDPLTSGRKSLERGMLPETGKVTRASELTNRELIKELASRLLANESLE